MSGHATIPSRTAGTPFLRVVPILLLSFFLAPCAQEGRNSRKVVFHSSQFEIVGILQIPQNIGPNPAIIIVHGSDRGTSVFYQQMRERFLSAGFATFIWDKPGFGDSRGEFNEGKTLTERAAILLEAISTLRKDPSIDPDRIGVWGVSQAGYVISLALQQDAGIAFMILVSAPGENSVQQTAYFVGQQARCVGFSGHQAEEVDSLAAGVLSAQTYDEYVAYGQRLLNRYPIVKDIDFMAGILPAELWEARRPDSEVFFDPVGPIERTTIPALVFFGELDKNVDPVQGASAYRALLEKAGHAHSKVILFPGVDHDMVPSETGCMKERGSRASWRVHSGYLDAMTQWLSEMQKQARVVDIQSR